MRIFYKKRNKRKEKRILTLVNVKKPFNNTKNAIVNLGRQVFCRPGSRQFFIQVYMYVLHEFYFLYACEGWGRGEGILLVKM